MEIQSSCSKVEAWLYNQQCALRGSSAFFLSWTAIQCPTLGMLRILGETRYYARTMFCCLFYSWSPDSAYEDKSDPVRRSFLVRLLLRHARIINNSSHPLTGWTVRGRLGDPLLFTLPPRSCGREDTGFSKARLEICRRKERAGDLEGSLSGKEGRKQVRFGR
jgi:hypothetical protein